MSRSHRRHQQEAARTNALNTIFGGWVQSSVRHHNTIED
jgi:acyl-CoA hydrolase